MTRDQCHRALEILAELEAMPEHRVLLSSGSIDELLAESPDDIDLQDIAGMLSHFVMLRSLGQSLRAADAAVEVRVLIGVMLCRPD